VAGAALLALGHDALEARRPVEADRRYGAALTHLVDPIARIRALAGRARARLTVDRAAEALADLEEARRLVVGAVADPLLAAELLLEEAIVLDWMEDFAASAARGAEAAAIGAASPRLDARLALARGRAAWRRDDAAEAVRELEDAIARARRAGDADTDVIAHVVLGPALCRLDRLDDAEAVFEETLVLCAAARDRLHEAAARVNRFFLWSARGLPERAAEDLYGAVRSARELGHPMFERTAQHNLAEVLYALGRSDEALPHARRCQDLERRFLERPAPENTLLLCRILLDRGDREDARRLHEWLAARTRDDELAPIARVLHGMIARILGRGPSWDELLAAARTLPAEELVELLYWRARSEASQAVLAQALALVDRAAIWSNRLKELACGLPPAPRGGLPP
jgi:eukaryotic-like serine/threonine-protein kinase